MTPSEINPCNIVFTTLKQPSQPIGNPTQTNLLNFITSSTPSPIPTKKSSMSLPCHNLYSNLRSPPIMNRTSSLTNINHLMTIINLTIPPLTLSTNLRACHQLSSPPPFDIHTSPSKLKAEPYWCRSRLVLPKGKLQKSIVYP